MGPIFPLFPPHPNQSGAHSHPLIRGTSVHREYEHLESAWGMQLEPPEPGLSPSPAGCSRIHHTQREHPSLSSATVVAQPCPMQFPSPGTLLMP